jgi:signal transduction histidine kinase
VGAIATFGFHRLRLRQISKKLGLRFEERLAERTRIAQELHDTLLQGVLSASMQLHVAIESLPENSPAQPALTRVLQLMGQVVEEGRNTLRGLRSPVDTIHDLESSFSRIPQEVGNQQEVDFRVIVEGPPSPLRPAIRDEVYRIGREALVNAFRHSRASNIRVQLEYASNQLRLVVNDDGCGINSQVLQSGQDRHWGLSGMRERAERMGAKLKVLSRTEAGTEVELRVPSDIAFESHPTRPHNWYMGMCRRGTGVAEPGPKKRAG